MPSDVDLLTITSGCIKVLHQPLKAKWIKALHNWVASYDSLPLAARLNIDTDFLATCYRSHRKLKSSSPPRDDHVPNQQLSLYLNRSPVLSNFDEQIRFYVNSSWQTRITSFITTGSKYGANHYTSLAYIAGGGTHLWSYGYNVVTTI